MLCIKILEETTVLPRKQRSQHERPQHFLDSPEDEDKAVSKTAVVDNRWIQRLTMYWNKNPQAVASVGTM